MIRLVSIVLLIVGSSNCFSSAAPVPTPNAIENDKTLFGIDFNKNGVRDDVELYLYDGTLGESEFFKAWMQLAKVKFEVIKFYPNLEQMKLLESKRQNALRCISLFEQRKKDTLNTSNLIALIFNNSERKKVNAWWVENYSSFRQPMVIKSFKKEEVCEF